MEITLNIDITKLNKEQRTLLAQITDRQQWPLKGVVKIKQEGEWEIARMPLFLRTRAKWEITDQKNNPNITQEQ